MSSKIDISSNALVMLGDAPINSFEDGGAGADTMANIYPVIYKALLTRTYWTFNRKKQKLNQLSQTPLNEWQFAFQIPTDSLRIQKITPRGAYKKFSDFIYTNMNDIDADYQIDPGESQLPDYFELTLTYKLAADAAIPVTDSVSKNELYEKRFKEQLIVALAADAQQEPQTPIQDQPFTDVRNGGFI